MNIPCSFADCRRLVALTLLTTLAFSWMWDGGKATASCGDYLMPLGAHSHASASGQGSGDRPEWLGVVRSEFAFTTYASRSKCNGPGCNGAPDSRDTMTVVTLPTRAPSQFALLDGAAEVQPQADRPSFRVEDESAPSRSLASIFKPPRLLS